MTTELDSNTYAEFVGASEVPVVIDFWAPWCGPCKAIAPILDELSGEMSGEVALAKINIDDNPEFIAKYDIKTIPALVVLKDGEYVGRVNTSSGFSKAKLSESIRIAIAG